ncbi:ABC transporter permease [Candidatus Rariloculus sp.]|uniref:ABC transporter permease n=1 Tax=Candidatus Rariloculus sp. TaxID=3101265 RepID=UPI003D125C95
MRLRPQTVKQWRRFRSIRRGYYSLLIITALLAATLIAELLVNSRAVVVRYEGSYSFPTYSDFMPGTAFGLDYDYETNYRELAARFAEQRQSAEASGAEPTGNWLLLPPVPYNPFETNFRDDAFPPYPPSASTQHYLGTDVAGRDILARLVYGFRLAMAFAVILLVCNYVVGIAVGCAMGFWGGAFDLVFQRLIEIWSNVPFLYVIMIVASVIVPNFWTLIMIMVVFGWMGMTWYMRTSTYKEKAREYVDAARALGASSPRIVFRHILPNTISIIVTFIPFSVATGVTALTALDYLGFGLPPPTPSWGELLAQGTANLQAPWIVSSVVGAMTLVLLMVAYVGEAIREAFDPKQFTFYE